MSGHVTGLILAATVGAAAVAWAAAGRDYPVQPAPFTAVEIRDGFWTPRLETNRVVTVGYDFKKCEETGRIDNFAKAGGLMEGAFRGCPFDDSDVFKVIEGAAYTLVKHPDPALDKYLDELIAKIAAAQEADGYLYSARRLFTPDKMPGMSGKQRWSNLGASHELYNVGHLYEAGVAHFQATGKRSLLDVVIKNADLVAREFKPGGRGNPPGHEEIEIGLVRLYRATGEAKYLELAKYLIHCRGRAETHKLYGLYAQDHLPIEQQTEAVGHAVRAGYLYSGVADVAALTGDQAYLHAIDRIWTNMVSRKMHITGGIGLPAGEAFGADYELPNKTAYNETCAAIANALWNHRMFLLHGDAKYLDVLERVIYNGFLAGIAIQGDAFFYPNVLEADGASRFNHGAVRRAPWFGCSCCPVNVVRFIPGIAGYIYAAQADSLYVNLFIGGAGDVQVDDQAVKVAQETRYPWDGAVALTVTPARKQTFALRVRIPGWVRNEPVPSDLYRYADNLKPAWSLRVNGKAITVPLEKGFAVVRREWKAGDRVELKLEMPVRRVVAHASVAADRGRVALERGPLVYACEGVDNGGRVNDLVLDAQAALAPEWRPKLLNGVTVLSGEVRRRVRLADGGAGLEPARVVAVPYYAWAHREVGPMAVWLAADPTVAFASPLPTLAGKARATASFCHGADAIDALNDQVEPQNSIDHDIGRFTWWDHKGTTEWVQYAFAAPTAVKSVAVYWFDDTGRGACRVPASWRLLYQDGEAWKPVEGGGALGVARDAYNRVSFTPVTTTALRIEVNLQPDCSGGILEWQVE